jgi:hypothetical protein
MDDITSLTRNTNEYQVYDDAAERFERMQKELLLSDLDSMPFRQAQMRTNRRVSSENAEFSQMIVLIFLSACFQCSYNTRTMETSTSNNSYTY